MKYFIHCIVPVNSWKNRSSSELLYCSKARISLPVSNVTHVYHCKVSVFTVKYCFVPNLDSNRGFLMNRDRASLFSPV